MDWKHIGTAPMDRTKILIYIPSSIIGPRIEVAHWSGWGGGVWDNSSGHHLLDHATHWMPLPPPPDKE